MASKVTVEFNVDDHGAVTGIKQVGDAAEHAGKQADDASGHFGKAGGALSGVASVAGGVLGADAIKSLGGFLVSAAQGAAEDQQATERLATALRNSGGDFDANIAKVNDRIEAGQKLAYGDDDVRDSFQQLLAATGDTDEALKRQAAAMDLARGAGIPLETATKMLGKLTDDNVQVFKKMGITLQDGATEADALALVQQKFGGQADAYAKSTAGQFEIAKIRMGEAKETIGTALLPAMAGIADVLATKVIPAIETFANYFQQNVAPKIDQFIQWLKPQLEAAGEYFSTVIQPKIEEFVAWVGPKLEELGTYIATEFHKFQDYYESDIKPALDNIITGVQAVIQFITDHWGEIMTVVKPVIDELTLIIETFINTIKDEFKIFIDILNGDWSQAWTDYKDLVAGVWDLIWGTIGNYLELVKAEIGIAWQVIKEAIPAAWGLIQTAIGDAWDAIKQAVSDKVGDLVTFAGSIPQKIIDAIGDVSRLLYGAGKDIALSLLNGLKDGAEAVWGEVKGWGGKITSLKGPIETDRVLLHPIGVAIAEGLNNGLSDGFTKLVIPNVSGWAGAIQNGVGRTVANPSAFGGGSTVSTPSGDVYWSGDRKTQLTGIPSSAGTPYWVQHADGSWEFLTSEGQDIGDAQGPPATTPPPPKPFVPTPTTAGSRNTTETHGNTGNSGLPSAGENAILQQLKVMEKGLLDVLTKMLTVESKFAANSLTIRDLKYQLDKLASQTFTATASVAAG